MTEIPTDALEPRISAGSRWPPGPSFVRRAFTGQIFRSSTIEFLRANARLYGDLVHFRAAGRHVFQLNHPALIQETLVRDEPHHHRGIVMQRARFVLGDGLLTSEEPLHLRQRRLTQPAFHRDRIAAYGAIIGDYALQMTRSWHTGETRDLHHDMLLLALRIVSKCLFNADVESEVRNISQAVDAFMGFLPLAFLPFSAQILRLPLPMMRRIHRGQAELDALIYGIIRQRRSGRAEADQGDLLSMLLATVDTEGGTGSMTDRQVRDECLTLLLAGHETTANALSFALWLAALHPEWQQRLHDEARQVLTGEAATAADYSRLPLTWQHVAETLRLYPPVWVTARTAAERYAFRGQSIPKGSLLIAPQIILHHDPRWWPDPERYDPARFAGQAPAQRAQPASPRDDNSRPRFAWFPFGAGSRQCIGEGFAWMEGVLALATILRDWRVSLPAGGSQALEILPRITLRPKAGVMLQLDRRT
ncbi:MAG TPA: cytochrome P450 [Acidobacteriaceae bacterium]|nr:cytochrome P450 [Acidobacteriaceae bacterium]